MSGRVLVVDDVAVNRRVLAAQLAAEYFEVRSADSGAAALALCEKEPFDLVLLDVMMPGIDGFEVCRRLKARPATQYVPVILLTALDQAEHRIAGLEAGADDFLTKPATSIALLSRIRALLRVKLTADEVRARLDIVSETAVRRQLQSDLAHPGTGGWIVLCAAERSRAERLRGHLVRDHRVDVVEPGEVVERCAQGDVDVAILDMVETRSDPLRLCARLKAHAVARRTAVLFLAAPNEEASIERAMALGAADYVTTPVDASELVVRVRTQVKRRRYAETLRTGVRQSAELAVRDSLTALYNRRVLDAALEEAIVEAASSCRKFSVLIADLDHFKQVNDRYGHDVGDAVLRATADRLRETIRASDLACRVGGEEFVVLMPDADGPEAERIGERLRAALEERAIETAVAALRQTVSIGVATLSRGDDASALLRRADRSLYEAKEGGRNRVVVGRCG